MVVLCDGMIRSGSTWSFNVVRALLRADGSKKVYGLYNENPAVVHSAIRPRSSHVVIKSHSLDPSVYDLCRSGMVKPIYTWRHPYDAAVSAMRMFGHSLEHWISPLRNALRIWSFHRSTGCGLVVSYKLIMTDPQSTVATIAEYLGLRLGSGAISGIVEANSLERVRALARDFTALDQSKVVHENGCVYHRETLLHSNHIRDGRIGYGLEYLSSSELAQIDAALQEEGYGHLCQRKGARAAPEGCGKFSVYSTGENIPGAAAE
ncbi:MAG TPA: hypothetical protein VFA04_05000 [Bryobacteraceae bacterium]|nr:hypothetical protein [Bryobacteraceae bacterium]